MTEWLPCLYAATLIAMGTVVAGSLGYTIGRWREQLALLEMCRPEH
ncbi:MAG: hypothetical protein WB821_11850 [Burkholderiaceae bacterium]